jgi:hypothetical protein
MRMKGRLAGILAMAMAMDSMNNPYEITERARIDPESINKPQPFHKHEGVLRMIEDYNLIKKGESKKGSIKQFRIKKQIEEWLEKGMLKNEDLKNKI